MIEPDPSPPEDNREEILGEIIKALVLCLETLAADQNTPREVVTNGRDLFNSYLVNPIEYL